MFLLHPHSEGAGRRSSGGVQGASHRSREQATQTIIQEQSKITMVEFQKAEESRDKAETQLSIGDRAYRESVGLTAPEFVDLRRIEVQKEIVQHSPTALTVIMGLERIGINMPPLGGGEIMSCRSSPPFFFTSRPGQAYPSCLLVLWSHGVTGPHSLSRANIQLAGCGKTRFIHRIPLRFHLMPLRPQYLRMLKMAVQQGRSERRSEAYALVR
jgi:hypothetical protein